MAERPRRPILTAFGVAAIGLALLSPACSGRAKPGKADGGPAGWRAAVLPDLAHRGDRDGEQGGRRRRWSVLVGIRDLRHPSLPNYLALTSGSTQGITDDCTDCHVAAPNIVDHLERAGISWKAYMEDLPAPCSAAATAGGYAKKHNPFMYYDDVARNRRRCRNVVGFDRLGADLRRGTLPTFAFISPNLCHDTHDCPVATGDHFLSGLVPRGLNESGPHGFVVLTWDEGTSDQGCCVDHYGVLRAVESALGLWPLGDAALRRSGSLDGLFARRVRVR